MIIEVEPIIRGFSNGRADILWTDIVTKNVLTDQEIWELWDKRSIIGIRVKATPLGRKELPPRYPRRGVDVRSIDLLIATVMDIYEDEYPVFTHELPQFYIPDL